MVVVFPGQGSQFVGMGKDLYNNYPLAKEIYKLAEKIIGKNFIDLSFEGSMEEISLTENSQPIIFMYSYILALILEEKGIIKRNEITYAAGHSLGEITSVVYSKLLNFKDGLKFVRYRGEVMAGTEVSNGGMYALLFPKVKEIDNVLKNEYIEKVFVANYNSYAQVVISGLIDSMEDFVQKYKGHLFKKAIRLKVSKPFHTSFMKEAEKKIKDQLMNYEFKIPDIKIFSNYTSNIYTYEKEKIIDNLSKQVVSSVRWIEIIENLTNLNESIYKEIGPKAVVSSFIKNINKEAICESFTKV